MSAVTPARVLRIAHVVTLVSPDGAYGGPVRVALNQLEALRQLGHEVTLFGGQRGFEAVPESIDGIRVRLFPVRNVLPKSGFAGLTSLSLQRALRDELRNFDVVHVHLARDLITLPAARLSLRRNVRLITQTHGMIDRSSNPLSIPLDAAFTRPVLRRAARAFYLTAREKDDLLAVAGDSTLLELLNNGVPDNLNPPHAPEEIEVLFLARLQARKRPTAFVKAALALLSKHPTARFTLIGPDEGEGAAVRKLISGSGQSGRISWEGALPPQRTIQRMEQASVYVLPSVNEPFPMSVLEAMSAGLPVIVTETCGLAAAVRAGGAGLVVGDDQASLESAIDKILSDERLRASAGANARRLARDSFAMSAVAKTLIDAYEPATHERSVHPIQKEI